MHIVSEEVSKASSGSDFDHDRYSRENGARIISRLAVKGKPWEIGSLVRLI
jgi:hypothetical protein